MAKQPSTNKFNDFDFGIQATPTNNTQTPSNLSNTENVAMHEQESSEVQEPIHSIQTTSKKIVEPIAHSTNNSFLLDNRKEKTVSKTLYMENAYHEVARLATVRNQFRNHSDFLNEVLRKIIDNRELPGLKVLYSSVIQQNDMLARKVKTNNFSTSQYDFLTQFIPYESQRSKNRGGKTYSICLRYFNLLSDIGDAYNVSPSHIIEKMFDLMVQQDDTTKI